MASAFDAVETVRSVLVDPGAAAGRGRAHRGHPRPRPVGGHRRRARLRTARVVRHRGVAPVASRARWPAPSAWSAPPGCTTRLALAAAAARGDGSSRTRSNGPAPPARRASGRRPSDEEPPWRLTTTSCSAWAPTRPTTRSKGLPAAWPGSCIPTAPAGLRGRGALQRGDACLRGAARPRAPGPLRPVRPRRRRRPGPGRAGDTFGGGLGDLFDAFFGGMGGAGGRRRSGPGPRRRRRDRARAAFREAVFGVQQRARPWTPRWAATRARGPGAAAGHDGDPLPRVPGRGRAAPGAPVDPRPGRHRGAVPRCRGQRRGDLDPVPGLPRRGPAASRPARSPSTSPPASTTPPRCACPGTGPAGPRGGPPGDLYVHLAVDPTTSSSARATTCTPTCTCSIAQAALGPRWNSRRSTAPRPWPCIPGTQTGHLMHLQGPACPTSAGAAAATSSSRSWWTRRPSSTKAQQELLRQFAAESGEEVGDPQTRASCRGCAPPSADRPRHARRRTRTPEPVRTGDPRPAPRRRPGLRGRPRRVPVLDADDEHHLGRRAAPAPREIVVACDGAGTWRPCRFVGAARAGSCRHRGPRRRRGPVPAWGGATPE